MQNRTTASARALAASALVAGLVVLLVVVAVSLDDDGSPGDRPVRTEQARKPAKQRQVRASYVVQNGDTLTEISRKTGISVSELQQLNPGVDPQILISGTRLKLR